MTSAAIMWQVKAQKQMKTSPSSVPTPDERKSSVIYQTVEELARELGVSRHLVYTGLRKGKIPHIRLGKRFVISRAAIANWLATGNAR
jgi:excisionase family DNA binding protein